MKLLRLLKVDTTLLLREDKKFTLLKLLLFQITTTESTPGLTHNRKKLIQPNGLTKLLKLPKVDTMLPLKEHIILLKPQPYQITTTE